MYAEVAAKDLKSGDKVLTRYYDENGMYQETDVPVVQVRVLVRRVQITFEGDWGTHSVPANKAYGVKVEPMPGHCPGCRCSLGKCQGR